MNKLQINDKVVYPGHGVCRVTQIETKEILGEKINFYVLNLESGGMKILVPSNELENLGVRKVISEIEANKIVSILRKPKNKKQVSTWNIRYREYMERLKSGHISEVAEVVRELKYLKKEKELSFGERKMLDTASQLLKSELKLVLNREIEL